MSTHRLLIPVLCLGLGLPAAASAQAERQVPASPVAIQLSFAPVVRRAAPAVVNVYSRRVVRQTVDPFWQMFGGGLGVPQQRIAESLGSGVIVQPNGVIVTNNHVIEGGQEIMVVLGDRREYPAKVLLADPRADVAVLKINVGAEHLPVLDLDTRDDAEVGDLVLAIGDPFGVGQTVTNGIVSANARTGVGITGVSYFIQTDAAINPGNSGGALVNMSGQMIAMNTAIFSQSGTSSGVGFAIPAALVKHVVDEALAGGKLAARPWLGLKTQAVTADIAHSMGLDRPEGVLVTDVWPGGPAAQAGLRQGDLITAVDDAPVNDQAALDYAVATHSSGDEVTVRYARGAGAATTARVRLAPPPGEAAEAGTTLTGHNPLAGATVVDLSPATADALGLDPFTAGHGVMITAVGEGLAARIGLQKGDLIARVNGQPVTTVHALQAALAQSASAWRLVIQRGGQTITAEFRL